MASTLGGRGIEHRDVWAASRRLGMYGMGEEELCMLIAQHRDSAAPTDRAVAAAARYVIDLKRGMAAGDAC
jgi:hypothetical protein